MFGLHRPRHGNKRPFAVVLLLQVWAIVDTDSDGKPEYTWQLVKDLNTPSGIALDEKEDILYVSGWEGAAGAGGKGMIWGLKDVSTAALQKKVRHMR